MKKRARPSAKKGLAPNARSRKPSPLFTIGYEKATVQAVLRELTRERIATVVDTRAVAASRRPGFSKRALSAELDEAGISYLHLQKLGTPAEGREAARAGDIERLWRIYDRHIAKREPQQELTDLVTLIRSGQRIALLCYCRNANACHRSRIVQNIKKRTKVDVKDLIPALL